MLVDVHAHLDDEAFDGDRDQLLEEIKSQGIKVINAGTDLETSRFSLQLAREYGFVYACVGVHPHEASRVPADYLDALREMARDPKVVAIGEIGLDYHYNFSPGDVQKEVFEEQLSLARELGLPVVVHSREADCDTLEILKKSGVRKSLMHCYSGSPEMAAELAELGFYFSFGGPLTFKNAAKTREVAAGLPRDRVLIETDCPYLTPEPFRGKRNDPTRLPYIAAALAQIWRVPVEEVVEITCRNAVSLFNIDLKPGRR
ncbi:TatD family hydrolase [Thermosediminibacter oceani]|uniref:Hydrolase, TatD family n=1 Tax=Thermosediminibacter oceani (strain ATCC BAA-1034 / DSM 16646 / JW/IW-1228P) TaxID=555079 RepID=D9RZC8_THEOJ|nr:TatD family hydrolase [Thermosediminibacter oceani]ADL06826.1 hydrolase, TatD family [Thermosediminibacter oceani DSM 16646]